jgi:hypothetical protein
MANFAEIMFPVLDAAGVRSLAEIGAYAGVLTRALLEWAEPVGARVIAVDPSPQAELLALAREREKLQLEQATSVEAIPAMDLPDAFIIDGDHNYFTVSEELRLIAERVAATSAAMPLLLFHDVCWPHARRDTYYAPDRIPDEYRATMVEGVGIFPDAPGLTWGGLPYKYAQKREGGERNGVLTAVEDFVSEHPDLELAIVPIFFGFGVCWSKDAPYADAVRAAIGPWDRNPMLARLEWNRVRHLAEGYLARTHAAVYKARCRRQEKLLREVEESNGLRLLERLTRFRRKGNPGIQEQIAAELEAGRNEPI